MEFLFCNTSAKHFWAHVVTALLLVCLPHFFIFFFWLFFPVSASYVFFLDHISLLLYFPFQSNLSSLSCYFPCRIYYLLCFLLTVPVPTPHLAQWHGDGAEQPGSDRFPGTVSASWVTASPFALPPLPFSTCSFFAINTWLCFSFLLSPPQTLCLHSLQH